MDNIPTPYDLDLTSIADELEADYNLLVRRFTFGVYSRVIRKSPVDTGRFRGNWIISIGRSLGTVFPLNTNKNSNPFINGNPATIDSFNLATDSKMVIQNNLPYAERLESGYSKQAPNGFLDISIQEELQAFK